MAPAPCGDGPFDSSKLQALFNSLVKAPKKTPFGGALSHARAVDRQTGANGGEEEDRDSFGDVGALLRKGSFDVHSLIRRTADRGYHSSGVYSRSRPPPVGFQYHPQRYGRGSGLTSEDVFGGEGR